MKWYLINMKHCFQVVCFAHERFKLGTNHSDSKAYYTPTTQCQWMGVGMALRALLQVLGIYLWCCLLPTIKTGKDCKSDKIQLIKHFSLGSTLGYSFTWIEMLFCVIKQTCFFYIYSEIKQLIYLRNKYYGSLLFSIALCSGCFACWECFCTLHVIA